MAVRCTPPRFAAALTAWLIVLAAPAVASADVFTVNTTADANDNVCEQIAPGDCPLRAAVNDAANGDTINVPAGNYVLTVPGGVLLVDVSVTIIGAGARQTVINGNNASRLIHVLPAAPPISVGVSGVTLTNGNGVGGNSPHGGAVHVAAGATLALSDSAVTNSHTQSGNGGGIYVDGNLQLSRVTVSGNQAMNAQAVGNGGGIYHNSNNDPARLVVITNSTISGNSATGDGGGIYSAANFLGLQSTTIAANTAARNGAGLYKAAAGAAIQDSIIAASSGAACAGPGVASVAGSNHLATDATCGGTATVGNPLLGPLANNGGPTDTHALGATSPAIGAASPAADRCTGTDQRGVARPQGGTCDIGAFEYDGTGQPPPGGGDDLPPPVAGKNVNLLPKSGTVKVKLPGRNRFRTLSEGEQLPVGTTVDTLKGRVTLVAAGGQSSDFYAGIFRIRQSKGSRPLTTLTLTEKLTCPKAGKAIAAAKKKKRRLWGDGSGRFRTKGKHSAATVVGTKWLVEDRCKSTLTRVVRGRVSVRDFVKKKTVIVRARKRYIARAG